MSYTRHQRLDLLAAFLKELANMDKELVNMTLEFIVSMSMLFLALRGVVPGSIAVVVAGFNMSIDLTRAIEAWRRARRNIEEQNV